MKKFEKKSKEIIKEELTAILGDSVTDEQMEKAIERELKNEDMKASMHKQKANRKASAENAKNTLKKLGFDKNGKKLGGAPEEKEKKKVSEIDSEELSYFFAKSGSRTELRQIKKVMKATGKNFLAAQADSLYTTFKSENDRVIKRRQSALPSSQGGGNTYEPTSDGLKKASQRMPAGFKYTPKKK